MKHEQLELFFLPPQPRTAVYDPFWDELNLTPERTNTVREQVNSNTAPERTNTVREQVNSDTAPERTNTVREQVNSDTAPERTNTVREQVNSNTAPEHNYPESLVNSDTSNSYTHWVEKYWVKRRGEKHEYYRYCWMEQRKICRCHISGRASSISAIKTFEVVIEAIADGESPQEIKQLIRQFMN